MPDAAPRWRPAEVAAPIGVNRSGAPTTLPWRHTHTGCGTELANSSRSAGGDYSFDNKAEPHLALRRKCDSIVCVHVRARERAMGYKLERAQLS